MLVIYLQGVFKNTRIHVESEALLMVRPSHQLSTTLVLIHFNTEASSTPIFPPTVQSHP